MNIQQHFEQNEITNNYNTLNQNFEEQTQNENNIEKAPNNISVIPLQKSYNINLGLTSNIYTYKDLNDSVKDIINDPKYNNPKRSNSAFSTKSFREKFEMVKLKVPTIKKWNCDPTAEIIIQNLEKKIDILSYENFLLTKNIKELFSNNNKLQINLNQNMLLMKNQRQTNGENLKINNDKIKNENDIDLHKEMAKLKEENIKLKKDNQILSQDIIGFKNVIQELNNSKRLIEIQFNEELEKYKDLFEKNKEENNNIDKKEDKSDEPNHNQNKESDNDKIKNLNIETEKDLLNEGEFKNLLNENERLHLKLKNLLSINDEINFENQEFTNNDTIENNTNNLNNGNKNIPYEELYEENMTLKEKVKQLNDEINKINRKESVNLSKVLEKLDGQEEKINLKVNEFENNNNKNEELDNLLNEALLMNANEEDEETKNMILTIQNMKDYNKKRISQCLIINNKLKSLTQENNSLKNKLGENNNLINIRDDQETDICLGNDNNLSYDYLINLLKTKDEIIQKYKDRDEEKELRNKELMLENRKLLESYNSMCKDDNNIKIKRGLGFEDYLVNKIVNNQKEVLGERAPRFKNPDEFIDNNKDQRYNNHFQTKNRRIINEE